jgi:DNA-binding CsgD family transcriptional regulator
MIDNAAQILSHAHRFGGAMQERLMPVTVLMVMRFVDAPVSLTKRERDIVALIADGQSSKGIARAMSLSHRTVERHVENCRFKLHAKNKAELVAKAVSDGFLNLAH